MPSSHPIRPVAIIGTGSYLPEKILNNRDLETLVNTSDEWITSRTGIKERRIARPDEPTSEMAAAAARRALENARVSASEIDLIIVATMTPDSACPSVGCHLQRILEAERAVCFDLSAACSGFLYGIETARALIGLGSYQKALVVAADKISDLINWEDRNTCVLFGDGAGAAVLSASETDAQIISISLGSNGSLGQSLYVPGGGSCSPLTRENIDQKINTLHMNGRETFKKAITHMADSAEQALALAGLKASDIKCVIPHQANIRIIEGVAERMELPLSSFFINLDRYGNTSAAATAIALDEAHREGRFRSGDHILLATFGAGFTYGASVVRW